MVGTKKLQLASFVVLGSASALQLPLLSQSQDPIRGENSLTRPLVDSEALQARISSHNLFERAKELYEIAKRSEDEYNHPTRVIGSEGHRGTLEYIYSTLEELDGYYHLSTQSFPAVMGNVFESRLIIGHQVPESASPMSLTPATKNKHPVEGDLVLVRNNGCDPSDYPASVKGSIAFVIRGTCSFGTKSELAGRAGAIAAVVYNTGTGVLHGTLGAPSKYHVATFGLSGQDAAPIVEKLRKGARIDSIAYIDAVVDTIHTTNILAQTVEGDPDNCVMLGGHSDGVADGPGINDDGSGSLSLLELATQLSKFRVNNCVRFAWWAAEEEGLLGSNYYVSVLPQEENLKIRLFMDYDMLASPNFAYQVYDGKNNVNPVGSEELRDLYIDYYVSHGLNYTIVPFDGRSDYVGFIENGIPGGGVLTGDDGIKTEEEVGQFGGKAGIWYDPCYHQLCDDLSNVNLTAWEVNTKLVAHSVATFAVSFEGFPERTLASASSSKKTDQFKYRGPKLVM